MRQTKSRNRERVTSTNTKAAANKKQSQTLAVFNANCTPIVCRFAIGFKRRQHAPLSRLHYQNPLDTYAGLDASEVHWWRINE